ncbi:hypothetical protein BH11PSE9_BH11PSE9_01310 [soil metagenome]
MRLAARCSRFIAISVASTAACIPVPQAQAADDDADALSLSSAPAEASTEAAPKTKFFAEGVLGSASRRNGSGSHTLARASLDLTHSADLAPGWRAALSDRLDYVCPSDPIAGEGDATINSLREAYVSWQRADGNTAIDLGRVNLRYGPGYGYNPTDFFRDGALRTMTSTNPLALRENRLGTFVLRGQQLWNGGGLSVAYSPKLADRPSTEGFSLDAGATNNRDRGLVALSSQFSDRISTQWLLYKERGLPAQIGASATALLTDAAVAHAEWSRGREPDLLNRAAATGTRTTRNRFVGGLTYTIASKLSITAEYQYNGFALDRSGWDAVAVASPAALGAYLLEAQRRQDLASRDAYLVYITQKSLLLKNLDATALLRVNAGDHSRLAWIELRHHWSHVDLALQLQQQSGRFGSEYGLYPDRRSAQLLATYFF